MQLKHLMEATAIFLNPPEKLFLNLLHEAQRPASTQDMTSVITKVLLSFGYGHKLKYGGLWVDVKKNKYENN